MKILTKIGLWLGSIVAAVIATLAFAKRNIPQAIEDSKILLEREHQDKEARRRQDAELSKKLERLKRLRDGLSVFLLVFLLSTMPVKASTDPLDEALNIAEHYQTLYLEAEASNDRLEAEVKRLQGIIAEMNKPKPFAGVVLTTGGIGVVIGVTF